MPSQRSWSAPASPFALRPCSLALQFVDAFTGDDPLERPRVLLQREQSPGVFIAIAQKPAVTPRGLLAYFGLEHRLSAAGAQPVTYRITIESGIYIPAFRETTDFETVQIVPFDELTVAPVPPSAPIQISLYPSVAYPFEPIVPVLHGAVLDSANRPVPDALVTESTNARVLTDSKGQFALPARVLPVNVKRRIDAKDRLCRTGTAQISLPDSLCQSVTITVQQPQQPRRTRNPHA